MTPGILAASCLVVALASSGVTALALRFALRRGFIDVPNERSSHSVPTPRIGGLGIVTAFVTGTGLMVGLSVIDIQLFTAIAGGGLFVAAIGFVDDQRQLSAGQRLTAHFVAAGWAVYWIGGMPSLQFGEGLIYLGSAGSVIAIITIVWSLNLFNFMDGIDGIAASEGVCVTWGAALLLIPISGPTPVLVCALLLGAASLGFLCWNWPPAKIFMGDVGSGFIGFCIAVLTIAAVNTHPQVLLPLIILFGVFLVDANVTLLRRLMRRKAPHVAHRSHAYQHLAARFGHRFVTLMVLSVNLFWLLPIAHLALHHVAVAPWMLLLALGPLVVAAIRWGAGTDGAGQS